VSLGARDEEMPRSWTELRAYMDRMYASDVLAVGADARALASGVLKPPFGPLSTPLSALNRRIAIGTMPPAIRDAYGFAWTAADERRLAFAGRWIRRVRHVLPPQVALWRQARG